jgi:hypothetical protein
MQGDSFLVSPLFSCSLCSFTFTFSLSEVLHPFLFHLQKLADSPAGPTTNEQTLINQCRIFLGALHCCYEVMR